MIGLLALNLALTLALTLTSATCAAGAGLCLDGRCLTAATAVELGVLRLTKLWP